MSKTDNILDRLQQAQQPAIDAPDELTEHIMASLPERGATPARKPKRLYVRWAIAACLLALLGVGVTLLFNRQEGTVAPIAQQQVRPTVIVSDTTERITETEENLQIAKVQSVQNTNKHSAKPVCGTKTSVAEQDTKAVSRSEPAVKDENIHYASLEAVDTAYQAPSLVDDFIAKLAEYYHIETEVLSDSAAHSVVYVFPDNDKVRLFDRLLQVACSYGYDSPGYQLTISQQQLMFTLEDRRLRQRHLWLAERIGGGRILLYATHAPTDTIVSSERYQDFREKITHTNQIIEL